MEEIKYLLLTILIETPVALLLLRKQPWQRVLFAAVCVNCVSHPIAWQFVLHGASWWSVEIGVALFEGVVFAFLFTSVRVRAGLVGVFMNVVSATVGHFLK